MKDKKLYRSEQAMKDKNPFKNELFMALSTDDTNEIIARLRSVLDQLAPDERNVFIVPVLITQICDNEGCVIVNGNNQVGDGNIQNNVGNGI